MSSYVLHFVNPEQKLINKFPSNLCKYLVKNILDAFNYWSSKPTLFLILLLCLALSFMIGFVFLLTNKLDIKNKREEHKMEFGVNWLKRIPESEIINYKFLFWFPANHRISTPNYDRHIGGRSVFGVSFDHVPEIRALFNRGVLLNVNVNVLYFKLEIDQECYDYLSQIMKSISNVNFTNMINQYRNCDFYQLFSGTGLTV